jgi:hypothetical protein
MCEKHLKVPPHWILETIKQELNLFQHDGTLDDVHDEHDKTLAYWRQNHGEYPPERLWDKYYFELLPQSFNSRHELWAWFEAREKQETYPFYIEEQRQKQMKAEEEKRLAQEIEQ